VSLDLTLVARPLSTRALTSSAKGSSHCSISVEAAQLKSEGNWRAV
jgi:hypothetical protein